MRSAGLFRAFALLATSTAFVTGCFALFSLEEYGPSTVDAEAPIEPTPPPDPPPPPAVDARPQGKLVFVTEGEFSIGEDPPGQLFLIANGRSICAEAAKSLGLEGRLFLPWLSDTTTTPANSWPLFDAGSVQLVSPDGKIIAGSLAELAEAGPRVPIVVTEKSTPLAFAPDGSCDGGGAVWSGTLPNGQRDPANDSADCQQWSANNNPNGGNSGLVGQKLGGKWSSSCLLPCNQKAHLYCFEQ